MPAFFAHKRGAVVRVTGQWQQAGGVLPFKIIMDGIDVTDPDTRAIITQGGIIEQGNFQFLHTLNETIYAYIFGDRIGELRVSGVCFAHPCDSEVSGMKQIIDNYRAKRIARLGGPVQVSFGEIDYTAFLVGMTLDVMDAERNLGQWAFSFNTFPGSQDNEGLADGIIPAI
jgi:hypothetical protein